MLLIVVPSRVGIPNYDDLKTSIEQMVGRINGEFVRPGGWIPVWYVYGSLTGNSFLSAAFAKELTDFPLPADYVADRVEDYLARGMPCPDFVAQRYGITNAVINRDGDPHQATVISLSRLPTAAVR